MTTNVKAVARALFDADDWVLTSELAANANMLDKPSHVSAIIGNLRTREFIQSEKAPTAGKEQHHRVIEVNREKFRAWIDRDASPTPSADPATKARATNKSTSAHRVDAAMRKAPMSLAQLASAAEAGTLPPHEDDEAADAKRAAKARPTVEEIAAWMMSTLRLYGAPIVTQYKVTGLFLEAIEGGSER